MISTQSLRREQEENNFTIKRNYIWVQYWYRYIKTRVLPQQYDFDLWEDLNSFRNLQKKKTWNRLQGDSYKSDKSKKAFTIKYCLTTGICDKLPIVKGRVRFLQVCWKFQEFLVISYEIKI